LTSVWKLFKMFYIWAKTTKNMCCRCKCRHQVHVTVIDMWFDGTLLVVK